jgi:arylsulfatase A-like enzyme
LAYVTDLAPTILELAGVAAPKGSFAGRRVESISGKSLLPLVSGKAERVHGAGDAIGYELGGNSALFKGDFKLVRDLAEPGDGEWHLFDIVVDPGEAHDLRDTHPGTFYDLIHEYERYEKANNVLPLPEGYNQARQIMLNGMRNRLGPIFFPGLGALAIAAASLIGWRLWRRAS